MLKTLFKIAVVILGVYIALKLLALAVLLTVFAL